MAIGTHTLEVGTRGNTQVLDLSEQLAGVLRRSVIKDGIVTVFAVRSTVGVTTTESEPGLLNHDLTAAFEHLAPQGARYVHEETWHDDNGYTAANGTAQKRCRTLVPQAAPPRLASRRAGKAAKRSRITTRWAALPWIQ